MNFILAIVLFVFYSCWWPCPQPSPYRAQLPRRVGRFAPGDARIHQWEKVETTERVVELIGLSAEREMQVEVKWAAGTRHTERYS